METISMGTGGKNYETFSLNHEYNLLQYIFFVRNMYTFRHQWKALDVFFTLKNRP